MRLCLTVSGSYDSPPTYKSAETKKTQETPMEKEVQTCSGQNKILCKQIYF